MSWVPLRRWGRFVQYWQRYAPIPVKRCMVCGRWFWNWWFWHSITWKHGCPEYCSRACVDAEELPPIQIDDETQSQLDFRRRQIEEFGRP